MFLPGMLNNEHSPCFARKCRVCPAFESITHFEQRRFRPRRGTAVYAKRTDESEDQSQTRGADAVAYAETIRNIHDSSSHQKPKADEEKVSVFWRIFGGT